MTDDVLRVDVGAQPIQVFSGPTHLRLRSKSKALAGSSDAEMSADGRHLVRAPMTPSDRVPLSRVIVPRLRPADHPVTWGRLDERTALFTLIGFPRVPGWAHMPSAAQHFEALASLVRAIPVLTVDVPWGIDDPGSTDRLVETLLDVRNLDV